MKLTFRDLKQQKFTIDAEPSETIAQLKEKIEKEKGWEASLQKLIYSGKILDNGKTIESYNIEEKGFIVCMVSKAKAPPAASTAKAPPATPAPAPASSPAPPAAPPAAPAASVATTNPPASPSPAQAPATGTTTSSTTQPPATTFNDPSTLLMGQQGAAVIEQMEAMGFQRAEIDRAMRAAFFNPDRAIDYLLNGIPESVLAEQRQGAAQQQRNAPGNTATSPPPQGNTQGSPAPAAAASAPASLHEPVNLFEAAAQQGTTGGRGSVTRSAATGSLASSGLPTGPTSPGGQVNMDFLRNNPHFQQLRQLVQQSPAMLEPILQQVAEGNPQLAQMIGANQDQFLQLLSEDLEGGDGQGPIPPGATTISVTEEERDAIDRLCQLGFPRDAVVQAYFACDKNEELAASFLFDQHEDDQQQ